MSEEPIYDEQDQAAIQERLANNTSFPQVDPLQNVAETIGDVGIGQNEYFSNRSKGRLPNLYKFTDELVYPADLTSSQFQNRQHTLVWFKTFKRKSQRASLSLKKDESGSYNFGAGIVDREGNQESGFTINTSKLLDEGPSAAVSGEKASYTTYGNFGGIIGGQNGVQRNSVSGELEGYGDLSNAEQAAFNQGVVEKIASDVRLSKATEQLEDQIFMYVPAGLNFADQVEYEDKSAGAFNAINEAISGNIGAGVDKLKLLGVGKLSAIAGAVPGVGEDDLNTFFQARLGFAENPRQEALFKGVNRKSFEMAFSFAPRSQTESIQMLNIIEAFRYHALPELSVSGQMLLSPHEFDVTFMHAPENADDFARGEGPSGYVENVNLPKIGRCFLKNISLAYAPNDRSAFFHDGVPTQVNMQLTFDQAIILNRQLVLAGF